MNKKDALSLLVAALTSFLRHSLLTEELMAIISGTGYERAFFKLFNTRLRMLSNMGVLAVQHEEFENLGNGLFSMHLAGRNFNVRVLYSFLPNSRPVLLLAFYERGGKNKTSYAPQIKTAQDRLASLKKEYEHEKQY